MELQHRIVFLSLGLLKLEYTREFFFEILDNNLLPLLLLYRVLSLV